MTANENNLRTLDELRDEMTRRLNSNLKAQRDAQRQLDDAHLCLNSTRQNHLNLSAEVKRRSEQMADFAHYLARLTDNGTQFHKAKLGGMHTEVAELKQYRDTVEANIKLNEITVKEVSEKISALLEECKVLEENEKRILEEIEDLSKA